MELSQQVCTLEQAKKLKELGIEQNSLNYFDISLTDSMPPIIGVGNEGLQPHEITKDIYSAFTVAELGEHLVVNDDTHFTQGGYNEHLGCWELHLSVRDESAENGFMIIHEARQEAETEAECRADMLIWLIEHNIILAHNCE